MNSLTDRLFRHMSWANNYVFDQLATLSAEELKYTAPNDEWTAAEILEHITGNRYADLLDGLGYTPMKVPTNSEEVLTLKELSAGFDARLREAAKNEVGHIEYQRDGRTIRRARQTILAQAIHHATEHRAQIAGIFASRGMKVIDLDEIDLWAFANYENVGD